MEITSELHDPKSPYFDPTLNIDDVEAVIGRQYDDAPIMADRREVESASDAQAIVALWVNEAGEPAKRNYFLPEAFGMAAHIIDMRDGRTASTAYREVGDGLLTECTKPANFGGNQQVGVSIHFDPTLSPYDAWDGGSEFFPQVSFVEADEHGYLAEMWRTAYANPEYQELLAPLGLYDAESDTAYLPEQPPLYFAHMYKFTDTYMRAEYRASSGRNRGKIIPAQERPALYPGTKEVTVVEINDQGERVTSQIRVKITPPEFFGIVKCYWTEEAMRADADSLIRALQDIRRLNRSSEAAADPERFPDDKEITPRRRA